MYDELGGYGVVIILLIILLIYVVGALFQVLGYVLAGLYTALAALGSALLAGLDALFSAGLFSGHPELGWAVAGLLLGAGVGAWTIAPVYGLRRARPLTLALPILLVLAICGYGFSRPVAVKVPLLSGQKQSAQGSTKLQLSFYSLTQQAGASTANFKLGGSEFRAPLISLVARPGEPDTLLVGGSDSQLGPFKLRMAPRHGGSQSAGTSDRYQGSYMFQLVQADKPVASFGVALPGDLVQWDRDSRTWVKLGDGRRGEIDIRLQRELGLARLVSTRSAYVLHVEFAPRKPSKQSGKSRYSADVATFPQGELVLNLALQGEEELVPFAQKRAEEEELLSHAFAKPLQVDIDFQRVNSTPQSNPFANAVFSIDGKQAARIEPLQTNLAVQAIEQGRLDTQTEHRELDHGLWFETPEFRALVRFCCEQGPAEGAGTRTISGSYVVTLYSRQVDFDLSFLVVHDGSLELIHQPNKELPGLRSGKNFIAVPAAQFHLPGNPEYLVIRFELRGTTQHTWGGNTGTTYVFPSGKLAVSSELHPRPRRK